MSLKTFCKIKLAFGIFVVACAHFAILDLNNFFSAQGLSELQTPPKMGTVEQR